MSWEATAYVKSLNKCPDGAEISRGQKCLLFVLADYHNTTHRVAWPSVPTLAEESLASEPQTKRDLKYFEEHCLIEQRRPEKQGRGKMCTYVFLALDDQKRLAQKLAGLRKGVQVEPLFSPEKRGSEGVHLDTKRGSEGVHLDTERGSNTRRNKEELHEPEPKPNYEQHACGAALTLWLTIKSQLQQRLSASDWDLWVRPAMLLKVMSERVFLIALPPNGRIIQEARARLPALVEPLLREAGYEGMSFTRYPDGYVRERVRNEFPEFYSQMFGNKAHEAHECRN